MDSNAIEQLILEGLPESQVNVEGDDGVHFNAQVISTRFQGKPTLQRHRLVYATLGDQMGGAIHALSLSTLTPEEFANTGSV